MNKLYKNSFLYIVTTLVIKAATFLLVPFYSYLISPSEYGYVYIVISFVTFMSLFVTCSLHGAVNRFYWECNNLTELRKMYSTITYMVAINATIVSLLMLGLGEAISNWLNLPIIYLRIAVFSSVLQCFYRLITALLYAKQEASKISYTSIIVGVTQILIQLSMVLSMSDKAMAMILSQLVCAALMFIIFIVYSSKYLSFLFDTHKAWIYMKYSICQLPSDVSVWMLAFSDRMMINKMKGSSITGIYSTGQTLGTIPKVVYHSINDAYVPFVFGCYKEIDKGNETKRKELKIHTSYIFSFVTALVTMTIIFSNNIISLLDSRYANASVVMLVMLIAMLLDCYRTMFMNPLAYNLKYIKVASAIWCSSAIINIVLNIYLIPIYSIYGACFSMVFSYFLTFVLIFYYARKAYYVEYDITIFKKVLFISLIAMTSVFLGPSLLLLPIKILISFIYAWLLLKLLNLNVLEITATLMNAIKSRFNNNK